MKIYKANILTLLLTLCIAPLMSQGVSSVKKSRILFVLSNASHYGNSDITTSNHFVETIVPYATFTEAGFEVDIISPQGGMVHIGYIHTSADADIAKYIYDPSFMSKLKNTLRPDQVDYRDYKAIFYTGGGAAMFGIHNCKEIQSLAMNIYEKNNGIISAICHGSAGIVDLRNSDGSYFLSGKNVNGFPNCFEKMDAAYYKEFPFSIEDKIRERGGKFSHSAEGWDGYSIVDGRLLTGQDPTSAATLAEQIIKSIEENF